MYFLKKNVPLLCFFILTIVTALTMSVLDIRLYSTYLDAKTETEDNVRKIQDISKKKPAPVKENVKAIEKDIELMVEKNAELQRMFGKIYRAPFLKFAETVGFSESKLLADFREYYNALPAEKQGSVTGETDRQILDDFLKGYFWPKKDGKFEEGPVEKLNLDIEQQKMKKNIEMALQEFEKYAAANFLNYDNNGYRFLLDAFGLPHTELAATFKKQMAQVNERIVSMSLIPGMDSESEYKESNAKKVTNLSYYTFDPEKLPGQRETYLACRQIQIRLDLLSRMKKAKLSAVPVMDQLTGLEGKKLEGDAYLCYSYKIEIEGSMDNVRNFLNNLTDAYKDNVVYNVREIQLSRPNPEDISKNVERPSSSNVRDQEGKLSEGYGRVVVGGNSDVHCYILLDYIMFVQDLLKRQEPKQS